jgi:RNA polymerase sigma-70 factor (ECF subfamily)
MELATVAFGVLPVLPAPAGRWPRARGGAGGGTPTGPFRHLLGDIRRLLRPTAHGGAAEAPMEATPGEHAKGALAPPADPIVDALRAGDEAAFLAVVNRYHSAMIRVAATYVGGSRAVAEEVAQEAWVGVLAGVRLFEGRSSLKTWIFRILVNCAKARGVREARSTPLSSLAREDDEQVPAVPADRFRDEGLWAGHWAQPPAEWTDDQVGSRELLTLVAEGLSHLAPAQRQVMTLRDVEGWEAADVCELMGISEANQRVLLHRARSKVRAYVEERVGREVSR